MLFLIIPTFREPAMIESLLSFYGKQPHPECKLIVVNSAAPDETSAVISRFQEVFGVKSIIELGASADDFWSGAVNVGLRAVAAEGNDGDYIGFANADVSFDGNTIETMVRASRENHGCGIIAPSYANERINASGVVVRSWFFYITDHLLLDRKISEVGNSPPAACDFGPTRLTLFPWIAFKATGFADERRFPHYAGDYDYTARLKKNGCNLLVLFSAAVKVDEENTGLHARSSTSTIGRRLLNLFSIRSSYNIIVRSRFVCRTAPIYCVPSALAVCFLKTLIEVLFAGRLDKGLKALARQIWRTDSTKIGKGHI